MFNGENMVIESSKLLKNTRVLNSVTRLFHYPAEVLYKMIICQGIYFIYLLQLLGSS